MAKTIPDNVFEEGLENQLLLLTKTVLIEMLMSYAHEDISDIFNNRIIDEWEEEQVNDDEKYKELLSRFKETFLPHIDPDDEMAITQEWANWTDSLCKDNEITEGQYSQWEYE